MGIQNCYKFTLN